MHSRVFYISEDINNKEELQHFFEDAPDENEIAESLCHNDYAVQEPIDELERSIEWLGSGYDFFEIKKDDIGFYFDVTEEILSQLQDKVYTRIYSKITELLRTINLEKNKNQYLWEISDTAYPRFEIQIFLSGEAMESVQHFILSNWNFKTTKLFRYYFITSYDYHY